MTAGYFGLSGYQINAITGQRTNLGPYSVPMSSVTDITETPMTAGTYTFPVPANTNGVAIIPPISAPPAGVTLQMSQVSGANALGNFISTQQPTEIQWDTVNSHIPANIYLVASGSITVVVQFL